MTNITFIEHSGTSHQVKAELNQTLMEAATAAQVPGIDADCGGACACGTCHVIVGDAWLDKLPLPSDAEQGMLMMTPDQQTGSRLACQVVISPELDGMQVSLPEFQM